MQRAGFRGLRRAGWRDREGVRSTRSRPGFGLHLWRGRAQDRPAPAAPKGRAPRHMRSPRRCSRWRRLDRLQPRGRPRSADLFGNRDRPLAVGIVQHRRELLAAQSTEESLRSRQRSSLWRIFPARGVAVVVVDRLEIIEVERHHRGRVRIVRLLLEVVPAFVQEGAAIGNTGQRIDHRRGLVALLRPLLRHRQQDEGDRDREQQRFETECREPNAAPNSGLLRASPAAGRRVACATGKAPRGRTA